jgi:hypothetical protein
MQSGKCLAINQLARLSHMPNLVKGKCSGSDFFPWLWSGIARHEPGCLKGVHQFIGETW